MTPHRPYDIHLNPPVLFGMPNAAFNEQDVTDYFTAVLENAQGLSQWVYFEHPQTETVLTNDAVEAFLEHYQSLADHGCIGIALQASNVIARVLRFEQELTELPIPFLASRNQIELSRFVGNLAQSIEEDLEDERVETV
jgi:hypothetical protein